MRKLVYFIVVVNYFLFFTFYFLPQKAYAQWTDGNYMIQTFFQNGVPHFNKYGKIQTQFNNDSLYLLGLYHVDIGPVIDENGIPKGQTWNEYGQQLSSLGVTPNNTDYFRNTLPEVKAAGFNTIYPMIPWYRLPNSWEMNLLDASGLKTIMPVGVYGLYGANNLMSTQKPASEEQALNGLFVSQYGEVAGSTSSINDGLWHYAAIVFDKTNWHIYFDGVEQKVARMTTNIVKNGQQIIGNMNNKNNPWRGELDEMHIYSRALNQQEVQQEFQTCPTLQTECVSKNGLVGLWHFDETSSDIAVDSSPNPQNGIATGTRIAVGKFGSARSFNNNTDRITVSDTKLPYGNSEISITFWLRTTTKLTDDVVSAAFSYGSDAAGQSVIVLSKASDFWTLNDLKYKVGLYKNRPTTFLWHLFDENANPVPDTHPMDEQKWKLVHDVIRQVDPDRAIFANAAGTSCWPSTYSDFSMFDHYTFYWDGQNITGDSSEMASYKTSHCAKPIVGIYQAFGKIGGDPGFGLPTPQQLKMEYLNNLIGGGSGLILFLQKNALWAGSPVRKWWENDPFKEVGINPIVNQDLWNTAAQMNIFIENNKKVFLSPTATDIYNAYINTTEGLGRSMKLLLKNTGESNIRYLLATNNSNARTISRVVFPGKTIKNLTFLTRNSQIIPITGNEFQIDLSSYGSELYKIEFMSFETITSSPTPTQIPCRMKTRGDLDCNDIINIFDYNILISNFGNTGTAGWHVADLNSSGKIDIFDYNILVSNFGAIQ